MYIVSRSPNYVEYITSVLRHI